MQRDLSELSNIQSESGIIGSLIYHPNFITYSDNLKPNHFNNAENACIYWAIQELYREGIENIDAYNVSNKIKSYPGVQSTLDKYNLPSVQEWIELYKETARNSPEEYKALADDVVGYAFKRDLVKALNNLTNSCFEQNVSLDELNNKVYKKLDNLTEDFVTSGEVQTLGEEIDDIWEEIVSRRTEDGLYGIPSKYPSFIKYFTYEPGELVTIQAKYKQGKSVFLMNEVVHKLRNEIPVLVVDSEMPTRLYTERLIAHLAQVDLGRVKNGRYSDEEAARITEAREWIKGQSFVHIYDPCMTDERLYSICKILQRKMGLQFLVYDYLKSNETSSSDNYNILGAKCDFLKNRIAGELNLSVLSACQLNRQNEVADSMKINRYTSVGIKWEYKTQEMVAKDGVECGNACAKIYVNRLGEQMQEDDEEDYIDFVFDGSVMTIVEAQPHERTEVF